MTTTTKNTPAIAVECTNNPNGDVLLFNFANGRQLRLDVYTLSETITRQALMHGLKQKLVDAAAISRNTETGRAASVEDKYAAVLEVYERLLGGEWNKQREGGSGASGGLLFRALCRMYEGKKTPEALREFLAAKTDAEKAAMRKNSKVAAVIEQIRAESAKDGGADGDALLAGLDD